MSLVGKKDNSVVTGLVFMSEEFVGKFSAFNIRHLTILIKQLILPDENISFGYVISFSPQEINPRNVQNNENFVSP